MITYYNFILFHFILQSTSLYCWRQLYELLLLPDLSLYSGDDGLFIGEQNIRKCSHHRYLVMNK